MNGPPTSPTGIDDFQPAPRHAPPKNRAEATRFGWQAESPN